jgi:hypothetical protein
LTRCSKLTPHVTSAIPDGKKGQRSMTLPLKPLYPYVYTTTLISRHYVVIQSYKPDAYEAFIKNGESCSREQEKEAVTRGEFVETGVVMIYGDSIVTQWKFEEFGG